ncbi:hypothetical protein BKE30_15435 [Alkanindiges hydrocarboniclasticus]|uniref:Uncharacterized protein n=2 Tax=Alkanindiges hydrocarboniclasticus TaxID=1907941 RepID=A0A1S8CPT7_9GAMM|nr:hypothetical protein BKE30_15435 [Alkanindiges hydrocarboniclasticus]
MNHKMLTDRDLANDLIPKRLIPPTPEKFKDKAVQYVFDDEDEVTLTFKEVVEMITTARAVGPRMVPVMAMKSTVSQMVYPISNNKKPS